MLSEYRVNLRWREKNSRLCQVSANLAALLPKIEAQLLTTLKPIKSCTSLLLKKKKKERNTTSLPQLLVTLVKSFAAISNLIAKGICLVQHFPSGLECHHHDFAVSVLSIHYYLLDTLLQSTFIKV